MRVLPALCLLLALLPSAGRAAPCPESYFCSPCFTCSFCNGSTASRRDTSYFRICSRGQGSPYLTQRYDLAVGSAFARIDMACGDESWGGNVDTYDVFRVFGPASSSPVAFTARLRCQGARMIISSSPYARAGFFAYFSREGGAFSSFGSSSFYDSIDTTLTLPLSQMVGEEFTLRVNLSTNASWEGWSQLASQLSFSGLPPGHAVVSCQGFASDPVVSARSVSWGRLKAYYR